MKKRIDPVRLMKSVLLGLPVAFALCACATDAADGKSGETHFLCKTDDDCTRLGDGYVCSASYCARASDVDPASGCLECAEDRDCPVDERCALSSCGSSASRCAPIAVAGPRGTWVTLDVTRASGPCLINSDCTSTWHVGPDGHVIGTSMGSAFDTQLSASQLDEFRHYVDGASLRTALRDGLPCMDDGVLDSGMTVSLALSTGTLSKEANGCIGTDNVLTKIYDVLSKL